VAPEKSTAQKAATVVSDLVQAWVDEAQHFYDSLDSHPEGYSAEEAMGQVTQSFGRVRPVLERAIQFNLDLLRPWSTAFSQATDEDEDA
jgi:hypothetical protein